MYFFSEIDPNYRIKGSRDPLGFQTLWASAGHKAVAHLSTVSVNLKDFMVLAYAFYFYGDRDENKFLIFFLKFEQLCAYARRIHNKETGFNGIDFVNKRKDDNSFSISLNSSDTLLSNQRNYGIYGKYIRPFRDIGLIEDPNFGEILKQSLSKTNESKVNRLISKISNDARVKVTREELIPIALLLKTLTSKEKELYRKYVLLVPNEHHPQNNLFDLIGEDKQIAVSKFNLHSFIQTIIKKSTISAELKAALKNIRNTDKVLFPLNRFFTHLLSQSSWTKNQIIEDTLFQNLPKSLNCGFQDEKMRELNEILNMDNITMVEKIIKRNEEVRKNPWIIKEKATYKVVYGENGQKQNEVDFKTGYEFQYFLNSYLSLYKQIEMDS